MGSMHTQGKDHVGTQKEGGHMQAKERDFERNQPYQNLYHGQSTSRSVRNNVWCLSHSVSDI